MTCSTTIKSVVLLYLTMIHTKSAVQGAGFTSEPHNTNACEGDSISFPCEFMGSSQYPSWAINEILYPRDYIPEQYDVHFLYLHIPFVSIIMNRNSYQCFVAGYESNIAILYVSLCNGTKSSKQDTLTSHRASKTALASFVQLTATVKAVPTESGQITSINTKMSTELLMTSKYSNKCSRKERNIESNELATISVLPVSAFAITISVTIIILLRIIIKKKKQKVQQKHHIYDEPQLPAEPVYEQISAISPVLKMEENDAYHACTRGTSKEGITMTNCSAYEC